MNLLDRNPGARGAVAPEDLPLSWPERLGCAVLLTLGLLGWELWMVWFLAGELPASTGTLARRLAWDAALLFPLSVGALGHARGGAWRRERWGVAGAAARVGLTFLLAMLLVAGARNLIQQRAARASSVAATSGRPISATAPLADTDSRFLCSAARAEDVSVEQDRSQWAAVLSGAQDALLLQVAVFPLAYLLLGRRKFRLRGAPPVGSPVLARVLLPGLLLALLGPCAWSSDGLPLSLAQRLPREAGEGGCEPGSPVRTYAVAAIAVDLPLNAMGDHVPQGLMYVLEENLPAVRAQERRPWRERVSPGLRGDAIQPLVLRANVDECLVIHFTNRLPAGPAALHIEGLPYSVSGAPRAGSFIPSTSLLPGQSLTFTLPVSRAAAQEGVHVLHDPSEGGQRETRGLFGVLVLEPAGSRYRRSDTGEPLSGSSWEAIIDVPEEAGPDFREQVLIYHAMGPPDVADVRQDGGGLLPILDVMAGPFRAGAFGLNYRSEPQLDRTNLRPPDWDDDADTWRGGRGAELATPMIRSYLGDPVRLRVVQGGSEELHLHALHSQTKRQVRSEVEVRPSPLDRPRLLSPGLGVTSVLQEEPGGLPSEPGDYLFHCHMPNHRMGGMQGLWRVFSGRQPDLAPLPDRPPPLQH